MWVCLIQLTRQRIDIFFSLSLLQTHQKLRIFSSWKSSTTKKIVTMKYLHRFCLSVVYCYYLARVCVSVNVFVCSIFDDEYIFYFAFSFSHSLSSLSHIFRFSDLISVWIWQRRISVFAMCLNVYFSRRTLSSSLVVCFSHIDFLLMFWISLNKMKNTHSYINLNRENLARV